MRTSYTILAYKPGTEVYAISRWQDHGEPTDHLAIYKARVASWYYDTDDKNVHYWLESFDGKEWGDSVEGDYISHSFDELITYVKELWKHEKEVQPEA
jgi:hypothetical protein